MPRPKGSKNKVKMDISPIKKIKLQPIKDIERYEMRRAYWFLLAIEKKIQLDPTSVTPDYYMRAVTNYTSRMRKYGLETRMDAEANAESFAETSGSDRAGQDGSADMGAGVPAVNPIT